MDPRRTNKHRQMRAQELEGDVLCFKCNINTAQEIHHIKPISANGPAFEPRNRVPLCYGCHRQETINPTFYYESETSWQKLMRRYSALVRVVK